MDTALTTLSVGMVKAGGRQDPYRDQWPVQLLRGIVRWKHPKGGSTASLRGGSSSSASSSSSSLSSVVSLSSGSADGLARVVTLVVVEPTEEEGSWMEHLNPPTPIFLHLRFPSRGIKEYMEACFAATTKLQVEEQEPPEDRTASGSSGAFESPPLGKPKEQHKTMISLRPLVKGFGVRLNWSRKCYDKKLESNSSTTAISASVTLRFGQCD